ncbi:MAG: hypothetical protein J0L89_01295 [Xanthomonadales bacterium]|nr:hypothetical protein [Xanthomonadales bacterium]
MPKLKKPDIMIVSVFLAFLFAWHYRADFIDIWRAAADTDNTLSGECA